MKNRLFTGIGLVAATTMLSGCSLGSFSFTGTMSVPTWSSNLENFEPDGPGDACWWPEGEQSYPDIDSGSQVVLKDSSGKTIAVSTLRKGGLALGWDSNGSRVYSSGDTFMHDLCVYEFEFEDVQSGDQIFSIEIGNRGEVIYSKEDLLGGPGLSLGEFGD
jgi:hypothetical protein